MLLGDIGKTISCGMKALRSTAELADHAMSERGMVGALVVGTGEIINVSMANAVKMAKAEGELDMKKFEIEFDSHLKEFEFQLKDKE